MVCGFDTLDGYFSQAYKENAPYFGCTVGRYSSQIKDAKFSLDGREYALAQNCGQNNLHGGAVGFDKKVWSAKIISGDDAVGVTMSIMSKDMEENFPGDVEVQVTFLLNNLNELSINYEAITNKTTPLSLTNHTYFNLSGFAEDNGNHKATIFASKKLTMDETGAATGGVDLVKDQPDDLRNGKLIRDAHSDMGDGFEHYYIFDKSEFKLEKVAEFVHDKSGRKLEVSTTEPGMLFYTGKYTLDDLKRESGDKFGKFRAFCCETHRYPNGPNIENSPKSITRLGEKFSSTTIFKIQW
ncbi:Aldose 1-epimerase [subsurface metagenome]